MLAKCVECIEDPAGGRWMIVLRSPNGTIMRLGDGVYEDEDNASMALTCAQEFVGGIIESANEAALQFYADPENYKRALLMVNGPTQRPEEGEDWKGPAPAPDVAVEAWGEIPVVEDGGAIARAVLAERTI